MNSIKQTEDVKMFLFARWISMCYADTMVDGLSVLNTETGHWYKEQLEHFNSVVYPNYVKNGKIQENVDFLNETGE